MDKLTPSRFFCLLLIMVCSLLVLANSCAKKQTKEAQKIKTSAQKSEIINEQPKKISKSELLMKEAGIIEVLDDVYDDQKNVVWIWSNSFMCSRAEGLADITFKKNHWQNKFPQKKIINISFTLFGDGCCPMAIVVVYYEEKK